MTGAPPRILCVGAAHWDVIGRSDAAVAIGDDLPGRVVVRTGGVAANVARAAARARLAPVLLSAVGADHAGDRLLADMGGAGIDVSQVVRLPDVATGVFVAIEDPAGFVAAIADTAALDAAGPSVLAPLRDGRLASAARPFTGVAVIDGNLSARALPAVVADAALTRAELRIVPASPAKAAHLAPLLGRTPACLCMNLREAEVLVGTSLAGAAEAVRALLARGVRRAVVTDGPRPAAEASSGEAPLTAEPPPAARIVNVTGAGDALLAAHIAAEAAGATRQAALRRAVAAASAHVAGARLSDQGALR